MDRTRDISGNKKEFGWPQWLDHEKRKQFGLNENVHIDNESEALQAE